MSNPVSTHTPVRRMLKCYPADQRCTLINAAGRNEAQLVDLNAGSARLRFADAFAAGLFKYRQRLTLDTAMRVHGRGLRGIRCRMTWKFESEIGVEFDALLPCCLPDIQASLDGDDAA